MKTLYLDVSAGCAGDAVEGVLFHWPAVLSAGVPPGMGVPKGRSPLEIRPQGELN